MKVLHVIDSGGLYGAEVMLLNLAAEQVQLGIQPVIASIGEPRIAEKQLEAEAARRGLPIQKFRMRPGPNICGALELLRFARRERCDLFHSHGYKGNILLGMIPRVIRKLPVVATLHGSTSMGKMGRMRLYEWADSICLDFIESVVLVNDAGRESISHQNLHVVNNGIPDVRNDDLDGATPLDAVIADFCRGGFTIGAIGRLSPEKGFDVLINAFKEVTKTAPNIRLVIFGEGGERKALELQVHQLGLEKQVLMPGYLDDAKSFLPLLQLFVLSSLTEGLPIVILEAMQAGVPIVATRVGGVPQVLENGKAGMLVNSVDSESLAAGISKLLIYPGLRSRLAKNAERVVRNKYSSSHMAEGYRKIYLDVLSAVY